jgi:hypothetical protein
MFKICPATTNDIDYLVGLVEQYRAFYKQELNPKSKQFLLD